MIILKYLLQYRNQIVGIIIILIFGIIMKSIYSHYSMEMKELNEEKKQIESRKELIKKWQDITKKNKELEDKFFREDILVFKRFIEEKSKEAMINLDYLSPSNIDRQFYWENRIVLKVTSPYKNIADFIRYIEDRNIKVEKLEIKDTFAGRKSDIVISGITLKD